MDTDLKHIARISLVLRRVEYGFNIDENKQAVVDQLDLLNAALAKLKMPQKRKMMDNEKYNRAFANLRFDLQSMINLSKSDLTWKSKLIKLRDQEAKQLNHWAEICQKVSQLSAGFFRFTFR